MFGFWLTARGPAVAPASYQLRALLTIFTTESITKTSIKTPTTVARAAPELKLNTLITMRLPSCAIENISEFGIGVELDQDRYGQHSNDKMLRENLLTLETEQQHERRQQSRERNRLQCGEQPREAIGSGATQQLCRTIWAIMTGTTT